MVPDNVNTQLFALRRPPPARLEVLGRRYALAKVFKHDFFAATALYVAEGPGASPGKLVVKFGRRQGFCGLPGRWLGRLLLRRERRFHRCVDGVAGVQRWIAQLSDTCYALEYVEGKTLDTFSLAPGQGGAFFDSLRRTLTGLHLRGAAYCDLNKRSNIVVTPAGQPVLIDFQVSVVCEASAHRLRRWLVWPWVRYLQRMDLYHLYKHKRRMAGDCLKTREEALSRRRGRLVGLHRRFVTPLRRWRRRFLTFQYRSGRLISPSAHLEDHDQPEKTTWRK